MCVCARALHFPASGRSPGGEGMATAPVFLPGESLWTEEPGRLQSIGSPNQTCTRALIDTHSIDTYSIPVCLSVFFM